MKKSQKKQRMKEKLRNKVAALISALVLAATTAGLSSFSTLPGIAAVLDSETGEGTFEGDSASPWQTLTGGTGEMTLSVADGVCEVYLQNIGGLGNSGEGRWDCQFCHDNLTIETGHTYRITYSVWSDNEGRFYTKLGSMVDDDVENWHMNGQLLNMTYQEHLSQEELYNQLVSAESTDDSSIPYWQGWDYWKTEQLNVTQANQWNTWAWEFTVNASDSNESGSVQSTDGTGQWTFHLGGTSQFNDFECFPSGTTLRFDNMMLIDLTDQNSNYDDAQTTTTSAPIATATTTTTAITTTSGSSELETTGTTTTTTTNTPEPTTATPEPTTATTEATTTTFEETTTTNTPEPTTTTTEATTTTTTAETTATTTTITTATTTTTDPQNVVASGTCGENLTWTLDLDGLLRISGDGDMDRISSREVSFDTRHWDDSKLTYAYEDIEFDSQASWADYSSEITRVVFEGNITSIGKGAFTGCSNLTEIEIPESIAQIGDEFSGDGRVIGDVFAGCTSLTNIEVAEGNTNFESVDGVLFNESMSILYLYPAAKTSESYEIPTSVLTIADYAFCLNNSLTSVTIPDSVSYVEDYAFANCSSLTAVAIPDSVYSIGDNAFSWCYSLTSATIGDGVAEIGEEAFSRCDALTSIEVGSANISFTSIDGVLFDENMQTLYQYPAGNVSESYDIPDGITTIADGAFYLSNSLASVTIPDSVTTIRPYAFSDCSSLDSITIPDGITTIPNGTFEASGLTSITIPDSVTSIGVSAFYGCYALSSVTIPDSVTSIGDFAFNFCAALSDVYYSGAEEQWNAIEIGDFTSELTYAAIHYNSQGPGNEIILDNITISLSELQAANYSVTLGIAAGEDVSALSAGWVLDEGLTFNAGECSMDIGVVYQGDGNNFVVLTGTSQTPASGAIGTITIDVSQDAQAGDVYQAVGQQTLASGSTVRWDEDDYINYSGGTITITDGSTSVAYAYLDECPIVESDRYTGNEGDSFVYPLGQHEYTKGNACLDGTSYEHGIEAWIARWNFSEEESWASSTFDLGGQYQNLSGTCKLMPTRNTTDFDITLDIEADGILIATYHLTPDTVPFDIDLDVLNCENLRVYFYDNEAKAGGTGFALANMVLSPPQQANSGTCGEDVNWSLSEAGIMTISGRGAMFNFASFANTPWSGSSGDIVRVDVGDGVTNIGDHAFESCESLSSVDISDSVTRIGERAFQSCTFLTVVAIPNSVTEIAERAFSNCSALVTVTIDENSGLLDVGVQAFGGTPWLQNQADSEGFSTLNGILISYTETDGVVTVPDDIQSIGDGVFEDNTTMTTIALPDGLISIGDRAFRGCISLTSIDLPAGLVSIGSCAFSGASALVSIIIPANVTSIGNLAFYGCSGLETITFAAAVADVSDVLAGNASLASFVRNKLLQIGEIVALDTVADAEGVARLSTNVFGKCTSLQEIVIPSTVQTIETSAFAGCTSLSRIYLPSSVTRISYAAFEYCTALSAGDVYYYVDVPDEEHLGQESDKESALIIGGSNEDLESATWHYYGEAITTTTEATTTTTTETTTTTTRTTTTVTTTSPTTTTITSPFRDAGTCGDNLTWTLDYDGTLTISGSGPMTNYTSFSSPFYWYSIERVVFDGTITTIGDYAFRDCDALTSITIPDSVTSIGDSAFYFCSGLQSITIPDSVTTIGESAFEYCDYLTDVYWGGTESQWSAIDIEPYNSPLTEATIHFQVEEQALGDLDDDGQITVSDASITLSYYAQFAIGDSPSITDAVFAAADVNSDGQISVDDASCILEYYARVAIGETPRWSEILNR